MSVTPIEQGAPLADEESENAATGTNIALPLLSAIIGLGIWEGAVRFFEMPTYLLPAPSLVATILVQRWAILLEQFGYTAMASVVGLAIGLALGIGTGTAISASKIAERMLYPWLVITHAVPKVVVAPLLLVWIGFGVKAEIIFVIIFTFFPILVSTVTGLKSADPELLQLVRSMGGRKGQTLLKIRIPGALPSIFAGIKISATLAPVGAVVGEFVASNKGLGHLLVVAVGNFDVPIAFAAVTVISVFGIAIWYLAELLERLAIPWHASQRTTIAGT